ncbi:MAG: hypothetical protein MJ247_04795 [Alphaproteobacteria bacterium]|nr:hypothetical protein [Alphaproteobacteria bacterium]
MTKEFIHEKRKHHTAGQKTEPVELPQYNPNEKHSGVPKQYMGEAIKRFSEHGVFPYDKINGYTLVEVEYKSPSKKAREEMREDFNKRARPEFLKMLANEHADELRAMGISEAGLATMREGRSVNGYNVHHNWPIAGGGNNDFRNLTIMPIGPHDELHHNVIDPQLKHISTSVGAKIKLPFYGQNIWKRPPMKLEYTKPGEQIDMSYIEERTEELKQQRAQGKEHKPVINISQAAEIIRRRDTGR